MLFGNGHLRIYGYFLILVLSQNVSNMLLLLLYIIMNLSVFSVVLDFWGIWVLYDCVCLCFMLWCNCVVGVLKMHAHICVITMNRT